MSRRDFLAFLSIAAAWPFTASGQGGTSSAVERGAQSRARRIGFLASRSAADAADSLAAFRAGLKEAGYVEGKNVSIDFRWAENQYEKLPVMAAELVRRKVEVIAALGAPATVAAKNASATIPIAFFMGEDPVSMGVVSNLSHPGANVTGVAFMSSAVLAKRLELLHELVPKSLLIAVLVNPKNPNAKMSAKDATEAGRAFGRRTQVFSATNPAEIERAFSDLARAHAGALLIAPDGLFNSRVPQLAELAIRAHMATSHEVPTFPAAGGLMSYGGSNAEGWRQAGVYAGRLLKGENPATLPVIQAQKLSLVINLKTAKALGLVIPKTILVRADELIE